MANSKSFKIAKKTAFEAKGRQYTTGKVIQRLFNVDLYTLIHISLKGEANGKSSTKLSIFISYHESKLRDLLNRLK